MDKKSLDNLRSKVYAVLLENQNDVENLDKGIFKLIDSFMQEFILNMIRSNSGFFATFIISFKRELNFNMEEALSTVPEGNHFILYLNPLVFFECNMDEMEALIKHEVYHILSLHHARGSRLKSVYSEVAVNLAMDLCVNQYIPNLPSWSNTLISVSNSFNVDLEENATLEEYAEVIQKSINKFNKYKNNIANTGNNDIKLNILDKFINLHSIWKGQEQYDEGRIKNITKNIIENNINTSAPESIKELIDNVNEKKEITWQRYLSKMIGSIPAGHKKTITRRNRRQPERLDLRGSLNDHCPELVIAIDISGSMTDKEIRKVLLEIKGMLKNYSSKITVIECDDKIRNVYKIKKMQDISQKPICSGYTKFYPVFKYIKDNFNRDTILIYFTDGLGEDSMDEEIYHKNTIWVITSSESNLSLKKYPGIKLKFSSRKQKHDNTLPLEYLKSEMKDIRSEWAK